MAQSSNPRFNVVFGVLLLAGCSREKPWDEPPRPSWGPIQAFEERFKAGDAGGAIHLARSVSYRKALERERILFVLGECHFQRGEMYLACQRYFDVLEGNSRPVESETIGQRLYQMVQQARSEKVRKIRFPNTHRVVSIREILEKSLRASPFGPVSAPARLQLAALYEQSKEYDRAARLYQQLYEHQAQSPWAEEALWRAAQMHRTHYKGRDYDPAPVLKAEEEALEYILRFPGGEYRPQMEDLLEEIRRLQRERLERSRRFYAKRKDRTAVQQYEELIRKLDEKGGAADGNPK